MKTRTKLNTFITLAGIALAMLMPGCNNEAHEPQDSGQEAITLVIPEAPAHISATRASWDSHGTGHWEEGDKLYIDASYMDKNNYTKGEQRVVALRAGGEWVFSSPIIPVAGAKSAAILVHYVHEYSQSDISLNYIVLMSAQVYDLPQSIIPINLLHVTTRFTLTGLQAGDRISFKPYSDNHPWFIYKLRSDGGSDMQSIPDLIADADGTATFYACAERIENALCFRVNGQPGGANEWHTFDPGKPATGSTSYIGHHFIINCSGLSGGSHKLED